MAIILPFVSVAVVIATGGSYSPFFPSPSLRRKGCRCSVPYIRTTRMSTVGDWSVSNCNNIFDSYTQDKDSTAKGVP